MHSHTVSDLCFTRASRRQRRRGLLGWVALVANGFRLDGLTVRRTLDGRFVVSFPARLDRRGIEHTTAVPANDELRFQIESTVLAELRARGELP